VPITIDPSSQFVYVANSGDGTVSGYALSLASPYLTPISGSPWTVGTTPSALVTDPWGNYLYVANSGNDSISAFTIDPLSISGVTVARIVNGKIVEGWDNWDQLGMLEQIGAYTQREGAILAKSA
jgi:DNA-binding beta-propeller fold protein YncE